MKKSISYIVFIWAVCTAFVSAAQTATTELPLKIGYTNVEYILSQLPEAHQVEADLKAYEKLLENQLEMKYQEYQKKLEDYQAQVSGGLMPPSIKADKERELLALQNSIREFEQNAEEDLQNKQVTLLQPLLKKVNEAIEIVASANGYTYIFSTHTDYGGSAIILYTRNKEKDDISKLVLKQLGVEIKDPATTGTTGTTTGTTNTTKPATTTTTGTTGTTNTTKPATTTGTTQPSGVPKK